MGAGLVPLEGDAGDGTQEPKPVQHNGSAKVLR
jgi:hypothetical protein